MTKEELIKRLREINDTMGHDAEAAHGDADDALLDYINDDEVRAAWDVIPRWYA